MQIFHLSSFEQNETGSVSAGRKMLFGVGKSGKRFESDFFGMIADGDNIEAFFFKTSGKT